MTFIAPGDLASSSAIPSSRVLFLPNGKAEARQSGGASPGAQHPRAPAAVLRRQQNGMGASRHHRRGRHHHGGQGLIQRDAAGELTLTKQGRAVLAALLGEEDE